MSPRDVVGGRVGPDVALEVDVVALLDGGWVKAGAEFQHGDGNIWKKRIIYCNESFFLLYFVIL